jgi:ketosteroid isomerase-like protein
MDVARVVWELEQRRRITEVLQDYCTLVDRNDPANLVRKVFAPDAAFELGSARYVTGHESLARMFAKTLAAFTATSHHLSNVRIAFDGDDHAHSGAYVYAWHRTVAGERVEAWGRYTDRLVLLAEGWRISNRHISMAGADGWKDAPFEWIERLPSPTELPSPVIERR